ncbi:MAG: HAD-IC family P-type ATPase, partial [Erysipelotrichales bacterium]|nr:HAD-IC family P-type ATPase [Erysipelotrichales bacterium]
MEQKTLRGLTNEQAKARIAEGKGNRVKNDGKSSSRDIIVRNVFTYFNLLYLVIFAVLAALGSYRNLLFIFVAVGNTGLGIYQQLKAKKVLDQMRILTDAKVETLREGKLVELSRDDLVLGDWIRLTRGDQIPADGVLREGYIETDESMLTGEFDPVKKETGSPLYSGSSVTSGTGYAELTCVGEEIYARKIMAEGKAEKRIVGTVQKSLTKILKIISALAVPFALLYLLKHAVLQGEEIRGVLLEVTGAMLGLIPAGLMLLTSVALSVSSMRLAQKGILFEEPYAVESIAKADLICLDKTGTLTEGKLRVEKVVPYAERDFEKILGNMMRAMKEESGTTAEAMRDHFEERSEFHFKELIPFSSDKKYSGVIFEEGTWYMGAAEYLLEKPDPKRYAEVLKISLNGNRVLAIVEEKDGQRTWIGSVILSDTIRTSLRGTLENLRA